MLPCLKRWNRQLVPLRLALSALRKSFHCLELQDSPGWCERELIGLLRLGQRLELLPLGPERDGPGCQQLCFRMCRQLQRCCRWPADLG